MERKKLAGSLDLTASLRAKLRDKNGKELLETKVVGQIENRFSKKTEKAIQIVWSAGKIVHLHCKDPKCGNEWKVKEGTDYTNKFDVNGIKIKCLKCGGVYESG